MNGARYNRQGLCCLVSLLFILVGFSDVQQAWAERLGPKLKSQSSMWQIDRAAETLYAINKITISNDYHYEEVRYYSIRINDLDSARDYGRIRIPYNHFYSDVELEFANVLGSDGKIRSVSLDAMQRRDGADQDFYSEDSELVFSLPDIAPGSIIEFQIRQRSKRLTMPNYIADRSGSYWFQPTVGGDAVRADPVHQARYEVELPSDMAIHIKESGPGNSDYDIKKKEGRTFHQWEWRKLPRIVLENNMPPLDQFEKSIRISTTKDWREVDAWAWKLTQGKFAESNRIRQIAAGLVKSKASRDDKIRAVYGYIQKNIRYVYAHLGRGGYEPHPADEVISKRYGDCKDQAILGVALLRALGVDAYPALIATSRMGKLNMELVRLAFDHMIVRIPAAEGSAGMWMDTTSDMGMFPGIYNGLAGQPAFVVNGRGGEMTSITEAELAPNVAKAHFDFLVKSNGSLQIEFETHLSGEFEQRIRDWWKRDHDREMRLRSMMQGLYSFPEERMSVKAEVLHHNDLWHPVTIRANYQIKPKEDEDFVVPAVTIAQIQRLFMDPGGLKAPDLRHHDWVNGNHYALKLEATFNNQKWLVYPMVVSSGGSVDTPYYTVRQHGQKGKDIYSLSVDMNVLPLNLDKKGYKKYYAAIRDVQESAGVWVISYADNEKREHVSQLKKRSDSGKSIEDQLKLTRHYISTGKFEEARKLAESVIKADEKNGQAWYLLGMAQGYSSMIDESAKSFNRATELGYIP